MSATVTIELTYEEERDPNDEKLLTRPGNNNPVIEPLGKGDCRRARWNTNQHNPAQARSDPRLVAMPATLPGYYIAVDLKDRTARVFDPLAGTDAGERIVERFKRDLNVKLTFERPIVREKLSKGDQWDWLKWMFRMVRDRQARVVEGRFPKGIEERLEAERLHDESYNSRTEAYRVELDPLPELVNA